MEYRAMRCHDLADLHIYRQLNRKMIMFLLGIQSLSFIHKVQNWVVGL